MKLNKSQKQFLFENCYVNAQVLDACVEPGWMNYFIKCFDWKLEDVRDNWASQKAGTVKLIDKDDKDFTYDISVYFQDGDYLRLLKLGGK